ncbi:MAG: hypothetical protein ACR2KG_11625 [Nocardioidaceae bacterium]
MTRSKLSVQAVITGIDWYTGFDQPDGDGLVKATGSVRGGHEICLDEIDTTKQPVWLHNCWGQKWGNQGRAYFSWDDLDKLLSLRRDCTVFTPLTGPPAACPGLDR